MMWKTPVLLTGMLAVLATTPWAQTQDDDDGLPMPPPGVAVPGICANLNATPVVLPNGDRQYPTLPCTGTGYDTSMGDFPLRAKAEAIAAKYLTVSDTQPEPDFLPEDDTAPQPIIEIPPQAQGTPVPQNPAQVQAVQAQQLLQQQIIQYNNLQMMRLGQLDAMQGRPINMQYANELGYLQGYTAGQQKKAQPGRGGFGGVSGFGR